MADLGAGACLFHHVRWLHGADRLVSQVLAGVHGFEIAAAGSMAALYSILASLSRVAGGGVSDRFDLRLRPWGNAGRLVYSRDSILRYYESDAELWELQALIKLAPVAGNLELGREFLRQVQPIFSRRLRTAGRNRIVETVRTLRGRAVVQYSSEGSDVKNGAGGIRDIEFLLQVLLMLHHSLYPQLLTGNTMAGLMYLEEAGIMMPERVEHLRTDYRFLRRIEHFLQVYDARRLHSIPTEPQAQAKLARIVIPGEAMDRETPMLLTRLEETLVRVRSEYDRIVVPATS
jgi:[glutamine synthetase] adenylyltransferase / [glutamine synthetase]-adenylyl-L-tyrosine phosphorylase